MTPRQRVVSTALGVLAGIVASAGTLAVTAAGFALSFDAIRAVGEAAHIRPSLTWLLPVCVDGAMAVSAVCAVVLQRMGRSNLYPWSVVVIGAAISIAANALHAYQRGGHVPLPVEWAMAASAVPALLLALSVHLVVILAEAVRGPTQPSPELEGQPAGPPLQLEQPTEPVQPEQPVQQVAPAPAAPKAPRKAARKGSGKAPATTGDRVAKLVARSPDLSKAQIAAKLGVSERTVQRAWPADAVASPNGATPGQVSTDG